MSEEEKEYLLKDELTFEKVSLVVQKYINKIEELEKEKEMKFKPIEFNIKLTEEEQNKMSELSKITSDIVNKISEEEVINTHQALDKINWENNISYKCNWDKLKEWLSKIANDYKEDIDDLDDDEYGRYFAYERTLKEMNNIEGVK